MLDSVLDCGRSLDPYKDPRGALHLCSSAVPSQESLGGIVVADNAGSVVHAVIHFQNSRLLKRAERAPANVPSSEGQAAYS